MILVTNSRFREKKQELDFSVSSGGRFLELSKMLLSFDLTGFGIALFSRSSQWNRLDLSSIGIVRQHQNQK